MRVSDVTAAVYASDFSPSPLPPCSLSAVVTAGQFFGPAGRQAVSGHPVSVSHLHGPDPARPDAARRGSGPGADRRRRLGQVQVRPTAGTYGY